MRRKMNLEIATKDEVLAWFASHPREKELLIASDSEITWAEGGQRTFEEIIETSDFFKHPDVGLIPGYVEDYGYENEVWSEVVFAEVYYLYIDKALWYYKFRRSSEEDLYFSGFSIEEGESYFSISDFDSAVRAAEQEVREFRRLMENSSVRWETRTWSNGKKFVYLKEMIDTAELGVAQPISNQATIELSDIYDSTAQIIQLASGKLLVRATLLDEYFMEVETLEEAKTVLEEFEQLWG
jgi:hypothetical protein